MSNEEYWMIHEMGETVLGSDEHLCRNMRKIRFLNIN